jgi:prolyl-tRNA editing enzyme YbaK/EbsC (Cys-tRNA(Pro) deacylase)
MTTELSKNARTIQDVLLKNGLTVLVRELSSNARTALDAATTLGCSIAQIVKSLLFVTHKTNEPVLILVSGSNRVNEGVMESFIGEKIVKADANFTRKVTGFAIGGIPPIGHKNPIQHIFIDEDLLGFDVLWAAAGTPSAVFSLSSDEFLRVVKGKVVAIK